MPGGLGEFSVPASTLSGAPGATAKLSTGLGVGAVPPWASTQTGKSVAPKTKITSQWIKRKDESVWRARRPKGKFTGSSIRENNSKKVVCLLCFSPIQPLARKQGERLKHYSIV